MEFPSKKRAFFVPLILFEGNFFNICVWSQCITYWIHFQNIQTFTYQKTLLHTLLLLAFKTVESFQGIFKLKIGTIWYKRVHNDLLSDVNTSHLWFSFKQIEHVSLASFLSKLTSIVVVYEELSGTLINFFVDDLCSKLSFFKLSAFFLSVLLSWFLLCFRKLKIGVDYINIWSYRNENGIRFLFYYLPLKT